MSPSPSYIHFSISLLNKKFALAECIMFLFPWCRSWLDASPLGDVRVLIVLVTLWMVGSVLLGFGVCITLRLSYLPQPQPGEEPHTVSPRDSIHVIIIIIIIIFIETRLKNTIGNTIRYRWLGYQVGKEHGNILIKLIR